MPEITLKDNTTYEPDELYISQLKKLYPTVDVDSQLRKISAWNLANPKRRKTRRGIRRHIDLWLSRAEESVPKKVQKYSADPVFEAFDILLNYGESKYQEFCSRVGMSDNDMEAVEFKFKVGRRAEELPLVGERRA